MASVPTASAEDSLRQARAEWRGDARRRHLEAAAQALRQADLPVGIADSGVPARPSQCPQCGAAIIWRQSQPRRADAKRIAMPIDAAPAGDGLGDVYVGEHDYRLIPDLEVSIMDPTTRRALHRLHRATCAVVRR